MQIIRDLPALRTAAAALRDGGKRIALVPTMGALHEGHMALVKAAQARADAVAVSIFVNPTQFSPNEDFDSYPRREAKDRAMLEAAGAALLWLPEVKTMYPDGFASTVSVSGITAGLDGAARPGHFDGVATVVSKLLNQVGPDVALFGEKDYQQLATIRRMVADLDMPIEIVGVPTERADDGLALSSRNLYLSDSERAVAPVLARTLGEAAQRMAGGADVAATLAWAVAHLGQHGFGPVDYVALCDAASLEPMAVLDRPARLLVAAWLGRTRLIDNIAVTPR